MGGGLDPLEISGDPPDLSGCRLDELVVEEFRAGSSGVAIPANVVWLYVDRVWYRLYFDHGIVFWRVSDEPPQAYRIDELHSEVGLVDLGRINLLTGDVITDCSMAPIPGGSQVVFNFASGRRVVFSNVHDRTTYSV